MPGVRWEGTYGKLVSGGLTGRGKGIVRVTVRGGRQEGVMRDRWPVKGRDEMA